MHGQWVGCQNCEAPFIYGQFHVEETKKLWIDICGLGFFELYINGKKVSEDVLTPVWSDYDSRKGQRLKYPINDERSYLVYYCRYDISEFIKEGDNTIEVLLGNGWYQQTQRNAEGEMSYGKPKLWFEIKEQEQEDNILCCSGEWLQWKPSNITFNNVYIGEDQDLGQIQQTAEAVEIVAAPEGEMRMQDCPADRVIREVIPKCIGEFEGRKVYDVGENITGWVAFTEKAKAGEQVTIRYAELINEDGSLCFDSTGGLKQVQRDIYTSAGSNAECAPHFTWHGFQYFDVDGEVENLRVQVVHTDVKVTGSFKCSDENINWMVEAYIRSRLGNMHCGVPMDCPHRERLGYTGDAQAVCGSDFWMLDADKFYRKWMDDIAAGQCKKSGHVQHTAPFYGGGGGPGGWGGAMVLIPWAHYRRYQDKEILKRYYHNMCEYIRYMYSRCDENGLVAREEERGWCLGEWCSPKPVVLPATFVNTYYLAKCLEVVLEVAQIINEECPYTAGDVDKLKEILNTQFYDKEKNTYAEGIQGADSFALDIDLGNQELADAVAKYYEEELGFDTGFLGTGILIRQLFKRGYGETAVRLLKSEREGRSYGWQRKQGATTLWERWDGYESHNHPMFGSPVQWLFEGLLGIQVDEGMTIQPLFTKELDWVEGSANTAHGNVSVNWKREGDITTLQLSVPCVTKLVLPDRTICLEPGEYKYTIE